MKNNLKSIVLSILFFTTNYCLTAQTTNDYRTKAGVFGANWADNMAWERYSGIMWASATGVPDASAGIITIVANSSINIEDDPANPNVIYTAVADQIVVESGATLRLKALGELELVDGPGTDLKVQGIFKVIGVTTLKGNGLAVIQPSGTMDVQDINVFGVGEFELKTNLRNEGVFNLEDCRMVAYQNALITNDGTLNFNGSITNNVKVNEFINNGLVTSSRNTDFEFKKITNNGTFAIMQSEFTLESAFEVFTEALFENYGTFDLSLGAQLNLFEINMNLYTGSSFTGLGRLETSLLTGHIHLLDDIIIPIGFEFINRNSIIDGVGDFIINGYFSDDSSPEFFGVGKLYINGQFDFSGSSGDREIVVNPAGVLTFVESFLGPNNINGNIVNNGTMIWTTNDILFGQNSIITNNSIFKINTVDAKMYKGITNNISTLINNGQIVKDGTGQANIEINNFTNSLGGTIFINGGKFINNSIFNNIGAMAFTSAGHTFENGVNGIYEINKLTDILTNGLFENKGTLTLNTDFVLNNTYNFTNTGTINGPKNLIIDNPSFEINGIIEGAGSFSMLTSNTWKGGTIGRNLTISTGKTLSINTSSTVGLSADLVNKGTINWQKGNLNLELLSSILTNNGIVDITGIDPLKICDGLGSFDNFGTLRRTSSGIVKFNEAGFLNRPTGIISGFDVYEFNNVAFINNGTISPGNSPGILALIGDQPLSANSTLKIEILNGSPAGFGYDHLARNSNLTLAGTLNVVETGVVPDGVFTIISLTSGTISGNFATQNLPNGYTIQVNPTTVTLTKTSQPLPISLILYTGKATENGNLLEWKTTNETNFSHFEIERSPLAYGGGVSQEKFKKIGDQKPNESKKYEFLDISSPTGAMRRSDGGGFYRLKLIDLDGKFSYSKIIYIGNNAQTPPSGGWRAVYPNPFSHQISVENIENKELKISLIDATGRELIKPISSILNKIDLNTEKIRTGIYFLQIKEGEKVKIQKMIKQ